MNPIAYWREKKKLTTYLGKVGQVISFTEVKRSAEGLAYWVVIVEFKDKSRHTASLVAESDRPQIGQKAKAVVRILSKPKDSEIINYGIKYQLI